MKFYGNPISGNSHRVQAMLALLNVEHEFIQVDLKAGEHKSPDFLAMNPLGQVPVLVDGDLVLRDSSAILVYLARKFDTDNAWLPVDPKGHAQVQEWLSTSVNEIQHGPFVLRAIKLFGAQVDADAAKERTDRLFGDLVEPHLTDRTWLAGATPTLAEVACYSYIARVTEGGYDLTKFPAICAWLRRVEQIEGFPPMVKIEDSMAKS